MTFGEALRIAMDERGITAKDICDKSGITAPYISKLLNGKFTDPTWQKACLIFDALDMSADEFRKIVKSE